MARTGAEGCVGVGGIGVFQFSVSLDDVCAARACAGDDAQRVRHSRYLLAACVPQPSANRSLIAFTAWSSFAHAALMAVQAFLNLIQRGELVGVAALVIIGVALIALAPGRQSGELRSAASA